MFNLFKKLMIKKEQKDDKNVENVILQSIINDLENFKRKIEQIKLINIREEESMGESLVSEQVEEINLLLSAEVDLLNIFQKVKNYIQEYIKEIEDNPYMSLDKKAEILQNIKIHLLQIKQKIEEVFVDTEFFIEKLNLYGKL